MQNRIDEIHNLTDVKSWRHCLGVENPADVGSRGCLASELVDNSLWWEGPAWLKGPPKNYPNSEVSKEEDLTEECRTEFKPKVFSRLLEHFWKRWSNEYLVGLREFDYCGTKGNQSKEAKVGDVVLIHDDSLARSKWRLGEIIELIESRDGHKRGAVLRTISKKGKPSTLRRAVQKLVALEVYTGNMPENEHVGTEQARIVQQPDHPAELVRPPRRAAVATADKIRRLLDQQ